LLFIIYHVIGSKLAVTNHGGVIFTAAISSRALRRIFTAEAKK